MRNKIVLTVLICIFLIFTYNYVNASNEEDVYDVILFWGQSNMVGYAGFKGETEIGVRDYRLDEYGIEKFSKYSGINQNIIENYISIDRTKTNLEEGTAYEYIYLSDGLKEINENTLILGEKLKYNVNSEKLEETTSSYSIMQSYGTNMIPQFCKTYYENTGRKVIVVFCANGGEKIANFLPYTDSDYGDTTKQYIFEAMKEKYNAAVKYLEDNGYTIGNKLYIAFQGESDVSSTSESDYYEYFQKVHNYLKSELEINKGAIIETSHNINQNSDILALVKKINRAQELLIEKEDIILGSSYPYDRFIPYNEATYKSEEYNNKCYLDNEGKEIDYEHAKEYANLSVCSTTDNSIHFTSAALAQIGEDVANAFSKVNKIEIKKEPKKKQYILDYEELDLTEGEITVAFESGSTQDLDMKDEKVSISGFSNSTLGEKTITVSYEGKTATFNVEIIKEKLTGIEISEGAKNTSYIEGQNFNSEGMKVIAKYDNGTSKEITDYEIIDGNNLTVGKTNVTISYTEGNITKTVTQAITVVAKSLVKIELITADVKQKYISKERLNTEGLVIIAIYDNGTAEEIREGFECSPVELMEAGEQTITVTYGGKTATYTVQVTLRGDADGNNEIDFMDILLINKHRLGKTQLTGSVLKAADVTNNGKIDFMDMIQINKYRLEKIDSL